MSNTPLTIVPSSKQRGEKTKGNFLGEEEQLGLMGFTNTIPSSVRRPLQPSTTLTILNFPNIP